MVFIIAVRLYPLSLTKRSWIKYSWSLPFYQVVSEGIVTINGKRAYCLLSKFVALTEKVEVQSLQYGIFPGGDRLYTVTFTCPDSVCGKYRPLFEAAAMSIRIE